MKKMFFPALLSLLVFTSSSVVFAMQDVEKKLPTDPVRIRFSSSLFRKSTSWVFANLRDEHFRLNSHDDEDENVRGCREIWIDDTEIKPLLQELRNNGMIILTQEEHTRLRDEARVAMADGVDQGRNKAKSEMNFIQRHPKKVIVGTIFLTALGTGALVHWWENR